MRKTLKNRQYERVPRLKKKTKKSSEDVFIVGIFGSKDFLKKSYHIYLTKYLHHFVHIYQL